MKPKYKITECNNEYYINGIKINNSIFEEELTDYRVENREEFVDTLIDWISEATTCKQLMKDDLKMLMSIKDEFILSSISTNDYLFGNSEQFNLECENILKCTAIFLAGKQLT